MGRPTHDLYCCATERLVHETSKFYSVKIPVPHHQLRHFISTNEDGRIYYIYKHDVYALNLENNQRCLLATLPFEARCLAADHGWICVGGEDNGDCAFIKIRRNGQSEALQDAFTLYGHPKCFGHDLVIKQLGGEIVNAMKIHKIPSFGSESLDEIVVLICNNDKSVKVYSLDRQKILTTLEHDAAMNYACMSPDSKLLLAVGDSNEVFFYERSASSKKPSSNWTGRLPEHRWSLVGTPTVASGESPGEDFSFSVTFSPDGQLCAISAQGGYISIFDIAALSSLNENESIQDVLIHSFRSSRPPLFGCIRSMSFAPGPWGLFAWAEDHGRAGIADLRQAFVRRQVLKLDRTAPNVTRTEVNDITPEKYVGLTVKERLKQQHLEKLKLDSNPTTLRGSTDYSADAWADELRRRQATSRLLYHQGLDLDARERSVLHALETTMDEVEQSANPNEANIPANRAGSDDPDGSDNDNSWPYDASGEEPPRRTGSRYHPPRRRSSVVLSPSSSNLLRPPDYNSRTRFSVSPAPMANSDESIEVPGDLSPLMSANDLTPSRQGSTSHPMPYDIALAAQADDVSAQSLRAYSPYIGSNRYPSPYSLGSLSRYSLRRSELTALQDARAGSEAELDIHLPPRFGRPAVRLSATAVNVSVEPALASSTYRRLAEEAALRRPSQIEALQRQARRSEDRVAATPEDSTTLEHPIIQSANGERHARILEERSQTRARVAARAAATTARDVAARASSAATAMDLERLRAGAAAAEERTARNAARLEAARQAADLQGRVSDNDMRLARHMIMSGARQALDRNGNWVSRIIAGEATTNQPTRRPFEGNISTLIEDAVREMGPGTAGVGWSPDGRYLFVGTEEGIFEYTVNLQDRMQFPGLEFR